MAAIMTESMIEATQEDIEGGEDVEDALQEGSESLKELESMMRPVLSQIAHHTVEDNLSRMFVASHKGEKDGNALS